MKKNDSLPLVSSASIHHNLSQAELIEHTLRNDIEAKLTSSGALAIYTGKYTGRAAEDKYVVFDAYSDGAIDWSNNVRRMDYDTFQSLRLGILGNLNSKNRPIYVTEASAGASEHFNIGVRLMTPSPAHALFAQIIFRKPVAPNPLGNYTIIHDPDYHADSEKYALHSSTVIAINFSEKEIIIVGTKYCGEIKKAIFTVMNTILPDLGILPMHTGANMTKAGNCSLFLGLSGTGKTTLSTDEGLEIIGDDEHALSDGGVFNFEGGCYAKTNGLKKDKEPDIFKATNQFKSILENVSLDPLTRDPLFDCTELTENGRATYSLKALEHSAVGSKGPVPKNIFFLSADALGVLPAVSSLDPTQAAYYFLSGYTAKLAGTELGLKGVKITFSHCFGSPFMMRQPTIYADLLMRFINKYSIKVWLINTGWYGGVYGQGKRYPLDFTRSCIREIQNGSEEIEYEINEIFDLKIPKSLGRVDRSLLNPMHLWEDATLYKKHASDLKEQFEKNFQRFK